MAIGDLQGKVTYVNPVFVKMWGYDSEKEILGKSIAELTQKGQSKEKADEIVKALRMKAGWAGEITATRKDGSKFYASLSASMVKDETGKPICMLSSFVDITERKKAEENLKLLKEFDERIIDSLGDALLVIDPNDYTIISVNEAALKQLGLRKEDMIGKNCYEKTHHISTPCQAPEHTCPIRETLETGRSITVEHTHFDKDNNERIVEVSAHPVKNPEGKTVVIHVARDITYRKNIEKKLEEYSQQLEEMVEHRTKQLKDTQERLVKSERLATIGQVAAMVGHDLRNPLTGISGAAYYLKMKLGPKTEKKMTQMLEIIEKDIQYSNKIITDLMDYSREIKLELTETTPKSIIAESISLIQIPEKVQLADSTLNEPKIKIDIDKMKRVFANFVKNAVEAMPQGGKLAISSRASSNNVEFMFIDSGVGMTKEVSEKIWTPFFTTKAKGMGLGLAICKRIIEAHQGKISVESIVGEGTTFTITIPIEPRPRVEGGEKVWVNMPESLLSTTTKA
jgi:PAS domain S-box-containing protein